MKKKCLLVIPALLGLFLSACGAGDNPSTSSSYTSEISSSSELSSEISSSSSSSSEIISSSSSGEISSSSSSSEEKKEFVEADFADASFDYDGKAHILPEVTGAPEGTTITYTGRNEYINVGTYSASAKLVKEGYNEKNLYATLTISRASFDGIKYQSKNVTYNGADHINDIQLTGVLPEGSKTTVTVKDSKGQIVTSAVNIGAYSYTCLVQNPNYFDLTLNATLTIQEAKRKMPVFAASDGTIYFANGLHNGYLYSLADGEFKLIDYSSPKKFDRFDSTSALFIAGSTLLNSAKEVSGGATSILYTDTNIDGFVKASDRVFYYSRNSLISSKSGIFKVDASDSDNEPIVTKVFEGKSDNLTMYQGNLYFSNGNDHNYLYKMEPSSRSVSLVKSEKMREFTISGGKVYCTIDGLLNDYIGYFDLSSSSAQPTKLTNASGENLIVKNGYLYYNNTDLFTVIEPNDKGIWRVKTSGGDPEQLVKNSGISGFDVLSLTSLVYVDAENLHLYSYNSAKNLTTDLLSGFVAPETTPLNLGGQTISLGTKTYYLNMYAGKTLYCYDESSKKSSQLTSNKVQDFYIYDGIMYFNQVTMLTNNDLYAVNLLTGGEAEKISSNDVRNMVSDGKHLYATHYNWAGLAGGLSRMSLDGSNYVKFSEVNGAKNLTIKDGKLYYVNCATGQDNGYIEYISLGDIGGGSGDLSGTRLSNNIKNVKQFAFDGNNIFYIYNGTIDNSVRRTDFSSLSEGTKIASSKTNPNEILLNGDYVYYYSYAASSPSSAGFYRVKKNATGDGTQELLVGCNSKY